MKRSAYWVAWCALATLAFAAPASAQGPIEGEGSMAVGNTTVSVGGGTAILTLPDVPSFVTNNTAPAPVAFSSNGPKFSDDFDDEWGWNVNGSIEAPMGANNTVSLNGFWANIDDKHSGRCNDNAPSSCFWFPLVDVPGVFQANGTSAGESMISNAERDVDHWGVSLEVKQQMNPGVMGVTQAPPRRTLALGADIRGIDQDLDVNLQWVTAAPGKGPATYTEELDTRYYGAYAAWGGDFPRLVLGGLWDALGLHSTFQLRGGIYYADTDYEGRITDATTFAGAANINSALTLSDDDVAFIGGLVMETKKRIGQRATLSLKSEYEYYSWVPEMAYNQVDSIPGGGVVGAGGQVGTVINDDDAFSMRSSLRLTIGLGPRTLYQEPMK